MSLSRHFRILIQEAADRLEDKGKSIAFGARGPTLEAYCKGLAAFLIQTKLGVSKLGPEGRVSS